MSTSTETATEPRYYSVYLLGRCANGAERDKGKLVHALPVGEGTALCGATYGRRSAGWSDQREQQPITCPRCLARMKRNTSAKAER